MSRDEGLGAGVDELLTGDGPYKPQWQVRAMGPGGCWEWPGLVWALRDPAEQANDVHDQDDQE